MDWHREHENELKRGGEMKTSSQKKGAEDQYREERVKLAFQNYSENWQQAALGRRPIELISYYGDIHETYHPMEFFFKNVG